jgi:hypothetical protein
MSCAHPAEGVEQQAGEGEVAQHVGAEVELEPVGRCAGRSEKDQTGVVYQQVDRR